MTAHTPATLSVGDTVKIKAEGGLTGVVTYFVGGSYAVSYRLGRAHFTGTYKASELELVDAKARGEKA